MDISLNFSGYRRVVFIGTCTDVDDYVTRGVSLGTNASAISTAQLLTTDPRAAALSSLSFAYVTFVLAD